MFCSSCGAQVSTKARFCSSCGSSTAAENEATIVGNDTLGQGQTLDPNFSDAQTLDSDVGNGQTLEDPTAAKPAFTPRSPSARRATPYAAVPRTPRAPSASAGTLSSSDSITGGRFVPGQIVADRYRIVALAGRGGMGEVYRAEDLKLSQIVAIKFLPESLSKDAAALARFHSEVRIARQVSHPNVCRMFDIGDADGIAFLTMEYVDGEDLSSLVRRIGRLSTDKATEVARQTCAGLAAAHDRGVIHRDLKPANLMLDSAGKIRITDFGLAGIAATIQGADVRAGTPAYMAPEQLAGKEVTIKSDLYSLGLVLYEILTGKRAFEACTLPELMKLREDSVLPNPSTLSRDIDPLLERVILRCLEKDAALRPSSALQVAAALPGGDPLAAALAAGETPSPQMVAASGDTTGLAPRIAVACLVAVLLATVFLTYVGIKENGLERIHPTMSSEVLNNKATEILARVGYPERPVDRAYGFGNNGDFIDYAEKNDKPRPKWDQIVLQRPMPLEYWYRQSPQEMIPSDFWGNGFTPGIVTFSDPAPTLSGMITIWMDGDGRLQWLEAIPPQLESAENQSASKSVDWSPLFTAAGIDPSLLHPATPTWNSLAASDTRQAWDGTWPESGRPLHVEAAAFRGKPVFFSLIGPWSKPNRMPHQSDRSQRRGNIFGLFFVIGLVVFGIGFALRNIAKGRGDRKGAWRIACVVFAIQMATFLLRAHFVASMSFLFVIVLAISIALFAGATMWLLYIALEPWVRRYWPQTIISWTRLIGGQWRDPLVGRDLIWGVLLGMAWVLVIEVGILFEMRAGTAFQWGSTDFLLGTRETLALLLGVAVTSTFGTLEFLFTLVLLRVLVRNRWLAAALFVVISAAPRLISSDHLVIDSSIWITVYVIAAFAVVRFGLVVLGVAVFLANVLLNLPYSLDLSNWYAVHSLFIVALFVLLGAWGFYLSLGGKPLWKDELLT